MRCATAAPSPLQQLTLQPHLFHLQRHVSEIKLLFFFFVFFGVLSGHDSDPDDDAQTLTPPNFSAQWLASSHHLHACTCCTFVEYILYVVFVVGVETNLKVAEMGPHQIRIKV